MPTPGQLKLAQLRDKYQSTDFLVHEVIEVDPTTSDEEDNDEPNPNSDYNNEQEEQAHSSKVQVRDSGKRNISYSSNELREEMILEAGDINKLIKEEKEWRQVKVLGGKRGEGEGEAQQGMVITPEKGGGGDGYGID